MALCVFVFVFVFARRRRRSVVVMFWFIDADFEEDLVKDVGSPFGQRSLVVFEQTFVFVVVCDVGESIDVVVMHIVINDDKGVCPLLESMCEFGICEFAVVAVLV